MAFWLFDNQTFGYRGTTVISYVFVFGNISKLAGSSSSSGDAKIQIINPNLMALREVAEARGYETLASEAGLSQKALYRILDEEKESKPRYETIYQIIHALGLRFTVEDDTQKVSKAM